MDRRSALIGAGAAGIAGLVAKLSGAGEGGGTLALSQGGGGATGVAAPPPVVTRASAPLGIVSIRPVPLGAGGFVTGIDMSRDGSRLACRTDVGNAYVRDRADAMWRPLFSPQTMLPADYDPLPDFNGKADGIGVAGVRIAPSDKNVLYASFCGYVWRSGDGGRTVRRTALRQMKMLSNAGHQRMYNWTIDVHPRDPNRLLVGSWGEGVWYSADGGARWTQLSLPPSLPGADNYPGLNLVLFDPESPDRIHVFVEGVGLFSSVAGPAGPFTFADGGPPRCSSMVAGPGGSVYLAEPDPTPPGRFWHRHPEKGWITAKLPFQLICLAAHPSKAGRLLGYSDYGAPMLSEDDGVNWRVIDNRYVARGSEVAWISTLTTVFPAQIQFDPQNENAAWMAHGTGVGLIQPLSGPIEMLDRSAGIEELCGISSLSVPGGDCFLACWDKPIWRLDDEKAYSNRPTYPLAPVTKFSADVVTNASYMDYAGDNPKVLVALVNGGGRFGAGYGPGLSRDGGASWVTFEGTPPRGWGYGGCIAASTAENFVILPSNNGIGAYTLDGGKSWASIKLDGANETGQFANAYYVYRKNIAADKTRRGVFALVYTVMQTSGDPFGNPLGGIWLTRDGGTTWTQVLKGVVNDSRDHGHGSVPQNQDARQFWQCQLEYVPGRQGELVYSPHADYGDDRLWWSRDDGASWTELHRSIRAVRSFGFGKAAPGRDRPAVYFQGSVKGVRGLYVSLDWFASEPALISRHPSPLLSDISWVGGDQNRFGRAYLGTSTGGWLMVDVTLAGAAAA